MLLLLRWPFRAGNENEPMAFLAKPPSAAGVLRHADWACARSQRQQLREVPALQGQILHRLLIDHGS